MNPKVTGYLMMATGTAILIGLAILYGRRRRHLRRWPRGVRNPEEREWAALVQAYYEPSYVRPDRRPS